MRIHIGKISPALAEKIDELEKRLARYGKLNSELSLHRKPYGDFYFAFVDMDIDQKQYGVLRTAFNGVTFRQSRLELKTANPSALEKIQTEIAEKNAKSSAPGQATAAAPVLNREQIRRSKSVHPNRPNVFPGRFRDDVRENPTFRQEIDGRLRRVKMKKRKMWGVERRPLERLVHHFEDGEWRDAENRAVEIIAELHDEHLRDQRIAEDFVAADAGFLSDSDFEEFKATARELAPADYVDDEIEIVPSGSVPAPAPEPAGPANTTESLRSALTAQDAPFTLFGSADLPADDVMEVDSTPAAAQFEAAPPKAGLFFAHAASPYLRSQSQAAKLVAEFSPSQWETEFYEHRGEWNRELRQRQRDALRRARRMGKKRGE